MKVGTVTQKFIVSQMRLDGKFHLSDGLKVRALINKSPYGLKKIKDMCSDIYCPGIFRRHYVKSGTAFLGGGDIQKSDLDSGKYLRESSTPNYEVLQIKKGWTLVTCGGTIGDCVFANNLHAKCWASQHVMRVIPASIKEGMLYGYLASNYGKLLLCTDTYGSVIPTLNAESIGTLPIPNFPESFQQQVDELIQESAKLREEATALLSDAQKKLKEYASLKDLDTSDYDFYGPSVKGREPSTFVLSRKSIDTTSINAFNYSERIRKTKLLVRNSVPLKEVLLDGETFSTGSFPRVEVNSTNGIMLINQSDIFDTIIKGKYISRRNVKTHNLVEYGEVLVAGVGTLGESETFCRAIYANEDLVGQLVSGEFIRMKVNSTIPSGYLFAWLNSDYGFRFIRNTQAGTKLCRPIPALFLEIPVPILSAEQMKEIDQLVTKAHTLKYKANCNERAAISMVEEEIEKWNN
jgi:restriction endonuclease S subunit